MPQLAFSELSVSAYAVQLEPLMLQQAPGRNLVHVRQEHTISTAGDIRWARNIFPDLPTQQYRLQSFKCSAEKSETEVQQVGHEE